MHSNVLICDCSHVVSRLKPAPRYRTPTDPLDNTQHTCTNLSVSVVLQFGKTAYDFAVSMERRVCNCNSSPCALVSSRVVSLILCFDGVTVRSFFLYCTVELQNKYRLYTVLCTGHNSNFKIQPRIITYVMCCGVCLCSASLSRLRTTCAVRVSHFRSACRALNSRNLQF